MWFLTWSGYALLSIIYFYILARVVTRAVIRSIHEHERNERCQSSVKGSPQTRSGPKNDRMVGYHQYQ